MIERKFVRQNIKEHRIREFIAAQLSHVGLSDVKLLRTPLGEKIIVVASRPGLVVGRAGANISSLTEQLKNAFELENPQVEIEEVASPSLDAAIIAEMIVNSLERFGTKRFKGIGHRAMNEIMNAGAKGAEILISGKIPGSRAKTWRFFIGHIKKCGEISRTGISHSYKTARLKSGVVGIKVSIMPPTTKLPDEVEMIKMEVGVEEVVDPEVSKEMEAVIEGEASTAQEAEVIEHAREERTEEIEQAAKKTVKKAAAKTEETVKTSPAKKVAKKVAAESGAPAAKKATKKEAAGADATDEAKPKKATKKAAKKTVKKATDEVDTPAEAVKKAPVNKTVKNPAKKALRKAAKAPPTPSRSSTADASAKEEKAADAAEESK